MRKIKLFLLLVLLAAVATGAWAQETYKVSVKSGTEDANKWEITPAEATTAGVAAGTTVTATYTGTKKVKSVKAVKKAAPAPSYDNTLNINTYDPELNNWENVTVPTGKHWLITGTGEATTNTIIIANNATVTLSGVNITAYGRSITCEGNATIILADGTTNNLYSAEGEWGAAGIEMSGGSGTSLTIQGNTGVLNITSGNGPAIGAAYGHAGCAINIEGGIINATSTDGPGIGAAYNTACGNITISGGTVAATGGYGCPGIGGAGSANCGDITITSGVTSVTATKGSEAPYSIGASSSGTCGTVTIGGVVYPDGISTSPYTYDPSAPAPVSYTAPTIVSSTLTYNGSGRALVTGGSATGGTIYYRYDYTPYSGSASSSEWSTTVPAPTNAGTYTVYYKVEAAEGYTGGVESTSLGSKVINKANGWVTLSPSSGTGFVPFSSPDYTVNVNSHGGSLSYNISGSYPEYVSAQVKSGTQVRIWKNNTVAAGYGTIVTITSAATNNYNAASANFSCNQ